MRSTSSNGLVLLVERKPGGLRDVWLWSVSADELVASGICLSEAQAWEAARKAAGEKAA